MPRGGPPVDPDQLRAVLDAASARRAVIDLHGAMETVEDAAEALHKAPQTVVQAVIVEAGRDYLTVVLSTATRLDLGKLALALGERKVRLAGALAVRAWLAGRRLDRAAPSDALAWYEVPLVTGLPTVIDGELLTRDFLYGSVGNPLFALKIAPGELRRATGALVADVSRSVRDPRSSRNTLDVRDI